MPERQAVDVVALVASAGGLDAFSIASPRSASRVPCPRDWTAQEVELVAETADRTGEFVERARAEAELRVSQERLRVLTETARTHLGTGGIA